MDNFDNWFIYKYCPSIPGPIFDDKYMGLSTSDNTLFIYCKATLKWYKPISCDIFSFKKQFEDCGCETYDDVKLFIELAVIDGTLKEINYD